jgi:hypothetical protein
MSSVRSTDFQNILDEAIRLKQPLPNIKEIADPQEALNVINRGRPIDKSVYEMTIQNFDPPKNGIQTTERAWYPKIFLNSGGMGGQFDGSGSILCIPSGRAHNARVFTFTMCEHEWDESGANHSRGWHPKRCKKCGFDASIDSGD